MPGGTARVAGVLQQANVQFYRQIYSGPLPRRLVAQTATITEISTSKPAIAAFSTGVVLTTTVLMATAGTSPVLTIGFRLGCAVMNSAIGGLAL